MSKEKMQHRTIPFINPPGAYTLLQSAPALFMLLSVLSMSPTHLQVCSNGVGHQALFKMGEKNRIRKEVLI